MSESPIASGSGSDSGSGSSSSSSTSTSISSETLPEDDPAPPPPPFTETKETAKYDMYAETRKKIERRISQDPTLRAIVQKFDEVKTIRVGWKFSSRFGASTIMDLEKVLKSARDNRDKELRLESAQLRAQFTDNGTRIAQLAEALGKIGGVESIDTTGLMFRADTRAPWDIVGKGFSLFGGGGFAVEARLALRALAISEPGGVEDMLAGFRVDNDKRGFTLISTAPSKDSSVDTFGGSGSNWMYAINVSGLQEYSLSAKVLGVPEKAYTGSRKPEKLLLDAPTLDQAELIAIQGGGINEVTFFTEIPAARIAWFKTSSYAPPLKLWFPADAANDVMNLLIKYGEYK